MYFVPGNDWNYYQFCKQYDYIGIRAFPVNGFVPKICECSNTFSQLLNRFIVDLRVWFMFNIHNWMAEQHA